MLSHILLKLRKGLKQEVGIVYKSQVTWPWAERVSVPQWKKSMVLPCHGYMNEKQL